MDSDILAIGFYAGILLMAATVVILTVIYITRPGSGVGIYDLQLWRKWNRGTKSPRVGLQFESIPTNDLSSGRPPAVPERIDASSPAPDQNPAVLPPVVAASSAGDQKTPDSKIIEGSEPDTSMKIKFPLKQAKAEEKSQVPPDKKMMEGGTSIPEADRAAGSSSPPEIIPAAVVLPVVAEKAVEPAKPVTEASQVKPEASQSKPPHTGETAGKKAQGQKASADDLSGLFGGETVDDSDTSKLADTLDDIDINNLLVDGLDLMKKLKINKG